MDTHFLSHEIVKAHSKHRDALPSFSAPDRGYLTDDMLALMDAGATYSFVQSKVVASRNLSTVDDFYTTKTMRIGDRDFGPLEMVVLPINGAPEIDALIGGYFFSRHKVCFDYGNLTVSFLD